ncbi:hypothetical protein [Bradyrhizobium sp.]|uniref:hypothetical protein n=1 Tax=Bradyrhizobium sp. TaxID=376 RepID=UPI003C712709
MQLLLALDEFREEQSIVGQLLMAYGEFEFNIAKLIAHAIGNEDNGARIFFRIHGEGPRLDVADAIVRPFFERMNLVGQWTNAFGALRYCKDVRNQYAHCQWYSDESTPLTFANLERDAAAPEGILNVQLYPVDLDLLQKQREYFEYANDWLHFLDCRCRKAMGQEAPDAPVPKSIPQPPKHNRPKKPQPPPEACTTPKGEPVES